MHEQTRNQNETTSPDWAAWAKAWGGVVVIAFLNGILRRAYEGALGELRSHQLSSSCAEPIATRNRIRFAAVVCRTVDLLGGAGLMVSLVRRPLAV